MRRRGLLLFDNFGFFLDVVNALGNTHILPIIIRSTMLASLVPSFLIMMKHLVFANVG